MSMLPTNCSYPQIPSGTACKLMASVHDTYYFRAKVIGWGIGAIAFIFACFVLWKARSKQSFGTDRKIAVILMISSILLISRSFDPMGMGGHIDYRVTLILLWAISCIAGNAQIGTLSGYLMVLSGVNPEMKKRLMNVKKFTQVVLAIKVLGDILQSVLYFVAPSLFYAWVPLGLALGMGVYVVHPLYCYRYVSRVIYQSNTASDGSGLASSSNRDLKAQRSMQRMKTFSNAIRVIGFLNFIMFLILIIYCLSKEVVFSSSVDPLKNFPVFMYVVDFLFPLIQVIMLVVVLRVFQTAAEVEGDKKFQIALVGLIALIGLLAVLAGELDEMDELA